MSSVAAKEPSADSFRDRFALRKRDFVVIAVVAVLVGIWVSIRGNRASEGLLGRPLRVGIVSWPGYAGGLVANNGLRPNKDSDFWSRGLLVEFVLIPDEEQLRSDFVRGGEKGGVDIMWSTVDSLAQQFSILAKLGAGPRAFLQVDWSRGGDAIVASADIKRIEDLKGKKKIAVSMAASQWLLEYSLENSSLTDVEKTEIRLNRIRTGGSREAREQFVDRSVDAAVLWEPDVSEAIRQRKGAHILVDTRAADHLIADVMVAKEEFIRQHPEVITAFIEGWLLDGTTKAINDPMRAVKVLQDQPEFERLGEERTQELLAKTALATLDDNVAMFGLSGGDLYFDRLFNRASRIWLKAGYITDAVTPERARSIRLLKEMYSARSAARMGCQEFETRELGIAFPPGRADLGPDARLLLDNEEISLLLRTHSGTRFCVQASADLKDDPQRALEVSRAREQAVIAYLVDHYNRPRSQFVSASSDTYEVTGDGKVTQYIRLKIVSKPALTRAK